MSMYKQTTEQDKYLNSVAALAPQTIAQNVQFYKVNRATFLGLPMGYQGPNGVQPVQQTKLSLSERLEAHGANCVNLLRASGRHKAFIEGEVAAAVEGLGGWDAVLPTGEWGFLFQDAKFDEKGKVVGYELPGLPFVHRKPATEPNVQPQAYEVDVVPAQDGTATAKFTPIGPASASSGDPL